MINFEKYEKELMKIKGRFAVDKNTREIVGCYSLIKCEDCIFNEGTCYESDKIKWLYSEYEPPILSDDELELIKAISKATKKEYKYVVRDAYGVIRLYETKPCTNKSGNYWGEHTYVDIGVGTAGRNLFSNITHKDGIYSIENKCFIKE